MSSTFSSGVRAGIILITVCASLSATAVFSLLAFIAYSVTTINKGATRTWRVSTHIHYYFVNLLVCDLVQAIGGVMNVKWAVDASVTEGTLCTTQGIFKQLGDVGVALSYAIAVHTFLVLVCRFYSRPRTALIVIAAIWIFMALIVGISEATHRGDDYYGSTGYWCWITSDFNTQRITLEYLWVWIAVFLDIVCYVFISLAIKGIIVVDGYKMRLRRRSVNVDAYSLNTVSSAARHSNDIARYMLFYPAVYIVTVIPISVVRWCAFSGTYVPFAATAFSSVCFACSGIFNTILFTITRPGVVPHWGQNVHDRRESYVTAISPISPVSKSYGPSRSMDNIDIETWRYVPESTKVMHLVDPSQVGSLEEQV
ncbi:uncharacterized protein BT62DRAFT_891013 [Guyanagaster necrorhizus]|uniref:Glucose receptor Git3 N-terminal domain-containing protein n=1 Tax=Guyanagaster necrorhizus TaxID=856835 RepID=A0A9P7VYC8_9AGAR|nr:uncharacterized protein BT62DRAFT_891013 [Guyanagaster necrorhizus MCA 3950]KAG7448091.1 hypothetical protein BT62DRAFT_891013 [Guyanagaster necrorhizus MCA 3950]